jgi:hypothetical protein
MKYITYGGHRVNFWLAPAALACSLLDQQDESMSPLVLASPVRAEAPKTKEDAFVGELALDWSAEDAAKLLGIPDILMQKFIDAKLDIFAGISDINFIKTTDLGASYCRGNNIILSEKVLAESEQELHDLLSHELFHALQQPIPGQGDNLLPE